MKGPSECHFERVAHTCFPRSAALEEETADDSTRQRETLDPLVEDGILDNVPEAAVAVGEADLSDSERRRLREFARRAEEIKGTELDSKVQKAAGLVADLMATSLISDGPSTGGVTSS